MIKKLLSSLFVTAALCATAQQVQNAGFETWTSNNVPANWGSVGQMLAAAIGTNPNTEVQTTSVHSGAFAALLQNQFISLAGSNVPGMVNTGPMVLPSSGSPINGYAPYASQPVSFGFWYKFNAMSGDTAGTTIIISHWNTGTNKRDTLATGKSYITGATSVYTQTTVPIVWLTPGVTPDSIQLTIGSSIKHPSSASPPPTGGQLYIDDVTLTLAVGVQTFDASGKFVTVYPNPASNILTISSNNFKAKEAKVLDMTGRAVATYELTDKLTQVDISSYENGLYMYSVTDEETGKMFTARFTVSK